MDTKLGTWGSVRQLRGREILVCGTSAQKLNLRMEDQEDTLEYIVVVNHEEQYSIWPAHKDIPAGWNVVDKKGKKVLMCPQEI